MAAPPVRRPRASIIIVCFGKRPVTERCLQSLDACLGSALGDTVELVLVDNASPDDTLELLDRWRERAVVLALSENLNFAGGCNAGAQAARGEALIFLNNDTVLEPGVLEELAETVLETPFALAGPRLLYGDGTIQHAGVLMVPSPEQPAPYHAFHRQDGSLPAARAVHELDCVTGACLAIRAEVFAELQGFDVAYRNGFEDVDLCLRARVAGHRILYRGDLAFLHDEGATRSGHDDTPNRARFWQAWRPVLDADAALAGHVWSSDVWARERPRPLPGGPLAVIGRLDGVGASADEARALVVGFTRAGIPVAGLDGPLTFVHPPVEGEVRDACETALSRVLPTSGTAIWVVDGPATARQMIDTWLRVSHQGHAPPGRPCSSASPGDPGWIAPAIVCADAPGSGGRGTLVALPSHDEPTARRILEGLARAGVTRARIVPTVMSVGTRDLVAGILPDADLLAPVGHDAAWEALAADADIAVCLDPDDAFDHRALVAAAAGAAPIVLPGGPAAGVLAELATATGIDDLPGALTRVGAWGDREARAARVRATCDPQRVALALYEIARTAAVRQAA